MPSKRGKRLGFEEEQQALSAVAANPRSADARARLRAGLGSERSLIVARAARLIKEHTLDGFEDDLKGAFARFLGKPAQSDRSCHAKLATIEALDYTESRDPAPFLQAVKVVQREPDDTAAPVRARGVLALARLGHDELDLVVAGLLTDPLPPVRQAALDALAHRGDRAGAALALYKLGGGDEDPLVTLAAMNALLALAPERALVELAAILDGDGDERRDLAAVALGQSRSDAALGVLLDALERCPRAEQREPLLRGIGLHRSERALSAMLEVIADRGGADATVAIEAIGARRFEPGVAAKVRAAAARNQRADLSAVVARTFGGDPA